MRFTRLCRHASRSGIVMQRNLAATADNDNRPAEFDSAVLAHMPALRAIAKRYIPAGKREDVIQDVLAHIFKSWRGYHGDGYGQGSGFYSWLRWCFRGVISNHKTRGVLPMIYGDRADKALRAATAMATQERALVARDMLERMSDNREGVVLLRRACGEGLKEISADMKISKERVRQLEVAGREHLKEGGSMSPQQVIAERAGHLEAAAIMDDLRAAGWIVVRHDAIRLAQAHAADEAREKLAKVAA